MATPPTRVAFASPTGNYTTTTSPKVTTTSLTCLVGDVVIVAASSEQAGTNASVTPTASAGTFTWTLVNSSMVGTTNQSGAKIWAGTCTVAGTATFSLARINTGTGLWWGMSATQWRGVTAVNTLFTTAPTSGTGNSIMQATTNSLSANSAVQIAGSDWNATAVATRTWQTVNGSAMSESLYVNGASHATAYGAYRTDVGAAGTKVVGLTTPATLRWVMVGVELVGASAGTDQALAGTVASTSAASGSIAARVALAGAVAATTALAGAIGVSRGLGGSAAATSATSGAITSNHPLGGTVAAITGTTGAPTANHPLGGSVAATTAVSGSLGTQQSLTGSVAATSTASGTFTLRAPLAGSVAAVTSTSGSATSRQGIAGTVNAVSSTAGTFFEAGAQVYPLAGNVTATTTTAGSITARHPLAGSVAGTTTTVGNMTVRVVLTGSSVAASSVSGALSAGYALSGQADAVSGTAGAFVQPPTEFQGRILAARIATPTAFGVVVLPDAAGSLAASAVRARLSILRATGEIT